MFSMLILGGIALSTAVVGGQMLMTTLDVDNQAEKLVEAAGLANHQAGDLGDSYHRIVPITDEEGNFVAQQVPEADDDPYEQYASAAEHEVRDAINFLNELLDETGTPPQSAYLAAVNQLQAAWSPRYERAARDYKVLAHRVHHTEKMAANYFTHQAKLTLAIANADTRERADANDELERDAYLSWRDQAARTLTQAALIKQDLDDMNIVIVKLQLSANFATLYEDFQELPQSMMTLHADIAEFQRQSDEITATFGPAGR